MECAGAGYEGACAGLERAEGEGVEKVLREMAVDVEGTFDVGMNGSIGYAAGSGEEEERSGRAYVEYEVEYEVVCEDSENEDVG